MKKIVQELLTLKNQNFNDLLVKLDKIEKHGIGFEELNYLYFFTQHKSDDTRYHISSLVKDKVESASEEIKRALCTLLLIAIGDKVSRYNALAGFLFFKRNDLLYLYGGILLQDKDSLVRVQASENLAYLGDSAAIPFLEASLADKDTLVRTYSAFGLGLLKAKKSVPRLMELQKKARSMNVKGACWGSLLILTKERQWLDKLLKILDYREYHVPIQVIDYLRVAIDKGIVSSFDIVPAIENNLKNENRVAVSSSMIDFLNKHKVDKKKTIRGSD